jgi:hypothetical protein
MQQPPTEATKGVPTENKWRNIMKHFPNTLRSLGNLAAAAILLGVLAYATGASAGVNGARAGSPRGYEQHKPSDAAGGRGLMAVNCAAVSVDRNVGGQRVWTHHGVITVGGHAERTTSTECR